MKKSRYKNRVCWITGASSGIGKILAITLAKEGAKLILSARNSSKLEEVKMEIGTDFPVQILPLDLNDHKEVLYKKVEVAHEIYGAIDIIFHVGGVSQRSRFENTATSTFEQIVAVNFWGAVYLTKALLPILRKSDDPIIVSINSVQGKFGVPDRTAYSASKHALMGFFDSLRAELATENIQITNILPGYVKTNLAKNALQGDGSTQGHLDEGKGGISVDKAVKDILSAVSKGKSEVVIGRPREQAAVYIKRFFPRFFEKLIRKK
ncbi:SDR family oxidoreductase [Flammeovirga kamogawensis]|uniref:SDR family oxidoreductase n=1 Tax=Flammeovirga kamogawensis TaxID=373891 RepID=A0ABX8GS15_9BACT|nr:SDR family oxidoreductase [Flammeovirga kamogawensis]MBB6463714.1 short-subunit dehydrogenase [Flammeovirga kamogawensis]QWG06213.1 SDR family oxidoreductase [Flammeovirga kamogawensis]TRX68044.1 SDR family oxidoreductase [Flammeovirga kamogawensis]